MRAVQYRLLTKLFNFLAIPEYIFAFEKYRSIPVMAQMHVEKQIVLSIDLKDFFHSITQEHLYTAFTAIGVGEAAARTISELCTYKFFVPQGALTSPKIANFVTAMTFGPRLKEYCDRNNLVLTIYADDVTISSNDDINPGQVIADISSFIREYGFRVNQEKTKIMKSTRRQYVCGVVVNKKTNLLKKERNRLRAIVHNVIMNGVENEANKSGMTKEKFLSFLRGKVNWYRQLNAEKGQGLFSKLSTYLTSIKDEETLAALELQQSTSNTYQALEAPVEDVGPIALPW